jgi:hypothetical protein
VFSQEIGQCRRYPLIRSVLDGDRGLQNVAPKPVKSQIATEMRIENRYDREGTAQPSNEAALAAQVFSPQPYDVLCSGGSDLSPPDWPQGLMSTDYVDDLKVLS